ncbi:MAG: DUF2795 domain-containing protein [Rhodospirillaceae bacterium]|nr:DUF2795 domain-containing protein [Rhodospirillales bacterium]
MARTLVQALEGLNFPCDRARIVEYASRNDIAPRAMDFLQRLPEQQYASMAEVFTALPSKGSLRKTRPQLNVVEPQENLPADEHEELAVQRAQDGQPQPNEKAEAAALDEDEDVQDLGEEFDQEQEDKPQDELQGNRPDEPTAAPEQAAQAQRSEPVRTPADDQGPDWRPPNLAAAAMRMDPFGVGNQWQRLWLNWYSKSAESYTRLFMPWLRR